MFDIADLPDGRHALHLHAADFVTLETPGDVQAGSTFDVRLSIEGGANILGERSRTNSFSPAISFVDSAVALLPADMRQRSRGPNASEDQASISGETI